MRIITTLSIMLFIMGCSAQERPEIHCKHFFKGCPYGAPASNDLIIRDIYALSNNDGTKFADWVAYRLTMHEVDGSLDIERKWRADDWLADDETLEPHSDYKGANKGLGFDRGHQAPLASFKGSRYASQCDLLSNITPQKAALNQGPWKSVEESVRELIRTGKTVYVMTGPLYERDMPPLPQADEPHTVPSGYWKVIIWPETSRTFHHAAFIMDQNSGRKDRVMDKLTTIDEVERRTGLDLLWELPDQEENAAESDPDRNWAEKWFN